MNASVLLVPKHKILPTIHPSYKTRSSKAEASGPWGERAAGSSADCGAIAGHLSFPCDSHQFLSTQVFVANPNKTQPILDILLKNQTKLIEFLSKFQNDRTEDEQFNDEKTYLVKQIRDLKRPAQQEA